MVESENAVQIALTCFALTLRAVYRYAWNFFFFLKNGYIRAGVIFIFVPIFFFFFFYGGGGVQFRTCPFILGVESENTG